MTWTCTVSVSFSPKKSKSCQIHVTFMAVSWHFHGTFTYKPYLGTVCQNLLEKLSKKSVLVVRLVFLPNFSFIFGNMSDSCRFHGPFMALSWRFLPSDFYCFSKQFHGTCMSDSWQIHRGFMPVSFSPKKTKSCQIHVTFMAVSWHFHGTFTYKPYLGTVCQNLLEKVIPKVGVGCRFGFFCLISASFLAICQIHVGFMALSWHFLPSDFYCFFLKKIQTNNWIHLKNDRLASMSDSSQIHRGFMALSCHFHGTFLSASQLCRIHRGFMSLSWQFHGTFTYKPYLGTVCQNLLEKLLYPKSRCWLSVWFFCLISASFLAICQIHVGFMALSWHFHGAFFLLIFIVFLNSFMALACQIHGRFMALAWRFHGTFLALSWHFPFWACLDLPWKCHESAKPRWNLHVRFMSICVCLFLSVCRQCFFDVIFIDGFWGSGWSIFSGVFFDQNIGL